MAQNNYLEIINSYLEACLSACPEAYAGLAESMSYSLNAGGKRIRAMLVLEFARICGADIADVLPVAAAVEMLHAYSLIHDDLPCMDNDDFRRGKPTNHRVYGETVAVLAGDALQCEAFSMLLHSKLPDSARLKCAEILSEAAGLHGMCGGQYMDTVDDSLIKSVDYLDSVNKLKTGALISAACSMGVAAAGGAPALQSAASLFGQKIGLAFQIRDDVLDVIGTTEQLGKSIGSDEKENKPTYMSLLGEEKCMETVVRLTEEAKAIISKEFSDTGFLCGFAESMIWRCS